MLELNESLITRGEDEEEEIGVEEKRVAEKE